MNIYVGNLNYQTNEDELGNLFANYGDVNSVKIMTDRDTGRSRGFAFIEMENDDDARNAIEELNQTEFKTRNLVVNEARPRSNDGGGFKGSRSNDRGPRRDY